jgi:hypothetical protein
MSKKPKKIETINEEAEKNQPLIDLLSGVEPTDTDNGTPVDEDDLADDPDDVIEAPTKPIAAGVQIREVKLEDVEEDFPNEFPEASKPPVPDPVLEPPKAPPAPVIIPSQLMEQPKNPVDLVGINQILDMFRTSLNEIITNQRADRNQLDENITFIGDYIRLAIQSGQRISPIFVDAYTRLLATKTDVNSNASRALDSVSRFLAAIKKNELIVKPGEEGTSEDIIAMLSQPAEEDEGLTK